ncbi:uncharacterized protein LOC141901233 [Tubulanus polymorphus]|uniref:uncharacterized protein LOC141901233 n=1 Tax=Tubulanus polymorphus TaxID=672921 RepID=UPI003DA46C55
MPSLNIVLRSPVSSMRVFRNNLLGLPPTRSDVQYQPTCQSDTLTDYEIDNSREEYPSKKVLELVAYTVYKRRLLYVCLASTLIFAGIVAMRLTVNIEPDDDDDGYDDEVVESERLTDVSHKSRNRTGINVTRNSSRCNGTNATNLVSENMTTQSYLPRRINSSIDHTPSASGKTQRPTSQPELDLNGTAFPESSSYERGRNDNSLDGTMSLNGTRSSDINITRNASISISTLNRKSKTGDIESNNVEKDKRFSKSNNLTNTATDTKDIFQPGSNLVSRQTNSTIRLSKKRKPKQKENEIARHRN